jgi:hypothetical protein
MRGMTRPCRRPTKLPCRPVAASPESLTSSPPAKQGDILPPFHHPPVSSWTNSPSSGKSFLEAADKVGRPPQTLRSAHANDFPHNLHTKPTSEDKSHTLLSRSPCRTSSTNTSIGRRATCLMPVMILPLVAWVLTGEFFFYCWLTKRVSVCLLKPNSVHLRRPASILGSRQAPLSAVPMCSGLSPMIFCLATLVQTSFLEVYQVPMDRKSRRS